MSMVRLHVCPKAKLLQDMHKTEQPITSIHPEALEWLSVQLPIKHRPKSGYLSPRKKKINEAGVYIIVMLYQSILLLMNKIF